jgi:hypothetical protein
MTRYILAVLIAAHAGALFADEVTICYNYGCSVHAKVEFSQAEMKEITALFQNLPNAAAERQAISIAIGLFEGYAGQQTPTWRDKGGNVNDNGVDGRMDCIDHSTNTTTYLKLLERHQLLKFHKVLDRVERAPLFFDVHWAGRIEETATHQDYVVDSWFWDNGFPAAVYRLEDWQHGVSPDA